MNVIILKRRLSAEWREAIQSGISQALENYELFAQRIDVSPDSMTDGVNERMFHLLSP